MAQGGLLVRRLLVVLGVVGRIGVGVTQGDRRERWGAFAPIGRSSDELQGTGIFGGHENFNFYRKRALVRL